jgi:hypothetical protein
LHFHGTHFMKTPGLRLIGIALSARAMKRWRGESLSNKGTAMTEKIKSSRGGRRPGSGRKPGSKNKPNPAKKALVGTSVSLPQETIAVVDALAAGRGISRSATILLLIKEALGAREQGGREPI